MFITSCIESSPNKLHKYKMFICSQGVFLDIVQNHAWVQGSQLLATQESKTLDQGLVTLPPQRTHPSTQGLYGCLSSVRHFFLLLLCMFQLLDFSQSAFSVSSSSVFFFLRWYSTDE